MEALEAFSGMTGLAVVSDADAALQNLLRRLEAAGYDFKPPTPATHRRVLARNGGPGATLRDILGWSRPFDPAGAPAWLVESLEAGGSLAHDGQRLKSTIRVARLKGRLFIHSAFPTDAKDAVFFGPDSYRFADLVERELPKGASGRIVDVGAGAGVGAIVAGGTAPEAELLLTDTNGLALRYARINAAHAGVRLTTLQTNGLDSVEGGLDAVIANPPYMAASQQTYRDGGGPRGSQLSLDWARAALGRLRPGGRLLLYTGSPIVDGRDAMREGLEAIACEHGAAFRYREVDPDVFGEELEKPAYADVERIAAVACVMVAACAS